MRIPPVSEPTACSAIGCVKDYYVRGMCKMHYTRYLRGGDSERRVMDKTFHGMSETGFYGVFKHMKGRCNNRRASGYPWYGARGIKVLWKSFAEFHRDMYDAYAVHVALFGQRNTKLERVDNNGPYCKENCRWVTQAEQNLNTSRSVFVSYKGVRKTLTEWCRMFHLCPNTMGYRLRTMQLTFEEAARRDVDVRLKRLEDRVLQSVSAHAA